ncbi:MAG: hypothetical protein ACC608_01395 [Anaerofustis sp.]
MVKGIPEGLLDVLAVFILTQQKFVLKKYIIISVVFIISNYLVRLLPINFGVNTMIGLLILVLLFVFFTKSDVPKLIKSTIIILITLFVCEFATVAVLTLIFGQAQLDSILLDPMQKALYGIPSTLLFAAAVYAMYYFMKKRKPKKLSKENDSSK